MNPSNTIGTCSLCGGPVVVPEGESSIIPWDKSPRCLSCGARPRNGYGPIIEMEPPRPRPFVDYIPGPITCENPTHSHG